ncbi:class I SAM-dependent methyltransferase [Candidatus Pelagibacter sp. Uisw_130]|uniref:class I SAM-dependent methyltransferase n=1 Tax=Candidatus Pelagibacter sp. Uisw_130 TaxID=3230989 RepID=UPI0039ED7DE3
MIIYKISDSIVFNTLKNIKHGFLEITKIDGETLKFGNPEDNLKVSLTIKDESLTYNLIKSGSIGLGESYMKDFFITNNLSDLIELTARNIKTIYKFSGIFDLPLINFFKNRFVKNTKNRSKKNIAKHYDLGNDFFSLWLDKSLTYSSAIFENSKQDLYLAQNNKYHKLTDLLKPAVGSNILEIGCGWGGFAEYLGTNYDVKLDCITISKRQFEFAKERIHKCGLNEKVNIEIKDYRDVKKKYDHIASIEMIEAVGQNYLDSYFKIIKKNLSPSGTVGIQAITIDNNLFKRYKNKQDFIQKYIFPGGFLPSKSEIQNHIDINGLKFGEYNSYADHYSDTLIVWRKEFNKKWDIIKDQGFDLTFKKMWQFYLSYCEAGFKSRNIDLIQFSLYNK